MVDIKKRSGNIQKFDRNKLKNSVQRAGADEYVAERVTSNVERRVTNGTNTSQIREWIIIELKGIPAKNVAENYNSYKKTKRMGPIAL
ncbi:MAG TPA: ATP cone domain-containing protein [Candidatus Sulfotelmatobacter sp.]|nr:ATP cone domain-containing protein [Candidatus Sulfotelmatobacter sp.]